MGSFILRIANKEQEDLILKAGNTAPSNIYGVAAAMARITRRTPRFPLRPFHLTAPFNFVFRKSGQLHRLSCITEDEINDKSKSDVFVKAIAITILWMLVQKFLRKERSLAVTQVEIALAAFSVFAMVIYILNWWNPKDVKTRIVHAHDRPQYRNRRRCTSSPGAVVNLESTWCDSH
jgi:hypothetical protein